MGYEVLNSKGEKIILADKAFSSGGEGEVRRIVSPARYRGNCVKIYYKQKRTQMQAGKIRFMADNPPETIQTDGFMIGWPVETIHHLNREFVGFMMPLAFPDSITLTCLTSMKLNKKLDAVWQKYSRQNGRDGLVARFKLMTNIAIPVFLLHSTGKYVLKDFKPENVLVTHSGKITVVDMDSIQITSGRQVLFPGTAATQDYMPPEFYNGAAGRITGVPLEKSWDNFALSVVFYKLLFGLHPYAVTPKDQDDDSSSDISCNISNNLFPFGNNADRIAGFPPPHGKFHVLPAPLQDYFKRAFSSDAAIRPNADEWGKLLRDIVKNAEKLQAFHPPVQPFHPPVIPNPPPVITNPPVNNHKTLAVFSLLFSLGAFIVIIPVIFSFIAIHYAWKINNLYAQNRFPEAIEKSNSVVLMSTVSLIISGICYCILIAALMSY
jgi:DNA-binding helix-hairpin-helix protein with protein kinase domain